MKEIIKKKARSEVHSDSKKSSDLLPTNKLPFPGEPFLKEPLKDLSPNDQVLFQRYGHGVTKEIKYACIHYAFEAFAKTHPKEIAIEHLGEKISYEELNNKANYLAKVLASTGVVTGDHVGLFVQRSIPMVIGILAILKVGAAYVPQHIGVAPESQLRHIATVAETKVILTLNKFKDLVPVPSGHVCLVIDKILAEMPRSINPNFKPIKKPNGETTSFIIFTSGTTGPPNGVQVTHKNVCNILLSSPGNLGIKPGMKVGQILSIAFDMSVWEILGCLGNGGTLIIRGKNIEETAKKVDVIVSTPTILSSIDETKCKNVKVVAVAGEPCPRALAEKWSKFSTFYNSCGPTETTIINTAQPYNTTDETLTIGKPTPNNTVYILDENMKPCEIGSVGEMWAGGDCVSKGYIKNEELTKERYALDPFLGNGKKMFRTRDLGRWTEKGELEHFGRTDDQVKIKGFRVELDSVSAVLEGIPSCKRAVALKYDNENLVAFVSPDTIEEAAAKAVVKSTLPYYCIPSMIISMKELPNTSRGKIDKRYLLELAKKKKLERETENVPYSYEDVELPPQKPFLRRIWDGPKLMHFNRLFGLIVLINLVTLIYGSTKGMWWTNEGIALGNISNVILINFTVAILIRQQYVINLLFAIATGVPKHWPLSIRRRLGKIYHFGGIHVGGNTSGTVWFIIFVVSLTYEYLKGNELVATNLIVVVYTLVVLLMAMIVFALPENRAKYHNRFELMHRFGGWTALLLFWIQAILFIDLHKGETTLVSTLLQSSSFWMLIIITFSIALPWMRLRKVPIEISNPSKHVALVKFNYGVTPFAGSSTAISRSPLFEWHSFANVPSPKEEGFRLTISRAGDWTGEFIDDLPSHVWVKGIPTAGVGNIDKLFKKVIWIATGSGIGPCLPHMLSGETPSLLVWATRNPRKTYGDELIDEILEVQPNAIIWDTDKYGKPDMVKLAYKAYQSFEAEAVICISNKKLTWKVVEGMESRNIPAYGAIWDS